MGSRDRTLTRGNSHVSLQEPHLLALSSTMQEPLDLSMFVRRDAGLSRLDLAVEGVGCAGCLRKIEGGLRRIPGIVDARLNFTNHRLAVEWRDGTLEAGDVIIALARIGYRAPSLGPGRGEADGDRPARSAP